MVRFGIIYLTFGSAKVAFGLLLASLLSPDGCPEAIQPWTIISLPEKLACWVLPKSLSGFKTEAKLWVPARWHVLLE